MIEVSKKLEWKRDPTFSFHSLQNVLARRGNPRGDGTVPSGSSRSKGIIHGNVFVVDEDIDLLDPIFQNGGKVNPDWRPSRNGVKGNLKGKPDMSSKLLEENITTDKKGDAAGRASSLFPRKPSDDVIDLDVEGVTKKPPVRFSAHPDSPSKPRLSTDPSILRDVTDERLKFVSPTPQVTISGPSVKAVDVDRTPVTNNRISKINNKVPENEQPGTVTVLHRDSDLVVGSDGKMYRLRRGPPGRIGAPGPEVSSPKVLLWFLES